MLLLLRDLLLSYDFMDWENILSGKSIEILFQTLDDDGDLSSFSGATLWRYLKELKARGIITETQKRIPNQYSLLRSSIDFLKEYERYFVNKISKTLSENSVILWQKDMEFLVRVPKATEMPSKISTKPQPQCLLSMICRFSQNLTCTSIQQQKSNQT